jgi:hypothetical protein
LPSLLKSPNNRKSIDTTAFFLQKHQLNFYQAAQLESGIIISIEIEKSVSLGKGDRIDMVLTSRLD